MAHQPSESAPEGLMAYARSLRDPTLKDYSELHDEIIAGSRLQHFKELLQQRHRSGHLNLVVLGTGGTFQSAKTDKGIAPTGSLEDSFKAMRLPYNKNQITLHLFEIFSQQLPAEPVALGKAPGRGY